MNRSEEETHVLLIDDDEIYLKVNELIIQSIGVKSAAIHKFKNGKEAIEHINAQISFYKNHKSIVLLDLNMPIMNGWEFLDKLQSMNHPLETKMKVYLVTSSLDNRDIESLKQYPFVAKYLNKPLSRADYTGLLSLNQS
jgi:CheY-like chemotaxis protein